MIKRVGVAITAIAICITGFFWNAWGPTAEGVIRGTIQYFRPTHIAAHDEASHAEHDGHGHNHDHDHDHATDLRDHGAHAPGDGHAHDHPGHDDATALELSRQALRNVGLNDQQIRPVELTTFHKSITVPAVIAEQPGRTRVQVATPMTGVITQVHVVRGEAVRPGTLLFQIRLTHEDLVQAQTDFLKTLGELDVEQREIERLTAITTTGAVAGKVLLEREYARDKLSALLQAQREALRLHGLSEQQVDQIVQKRRLLRELQIVAPNMDDSEWNEFQLTHDVAAGSYRTHPVAAETEPKANGVPPLILQQLEVHQGQTVTAGDTLCVLADYRELYLEGLAFEQDLDHLRDAVSNDWTVDAIFDRSGAEPLVIKDLEIAYLGTQVDADSRTLRFYVRFPNEVTRTWQLQDKQFMQWRYLPGQRLRIRVPVERWPEQIVLPVDAVAREGAEYFVFQHNVDHFDRVPVHVKYKDQFSVVIEQDGTLNPGDKIAMRGAHQMQMALKNKAGGGVDPHAGHNH